MHKVGDRVQLDNRKALKGEGEIIAILDRKPPNKQPNIVVKMKGVNGEFVQQVFEKDILPPKPTVVHSSHWSIGENGVHHGYIYIEKLSDGTWTIKQV